MSPAFKSKAKDKSSGKAAKEQQRASLKPSSSPASDGNVPVSAYNPASGTFHSLETAPPASLPTPQISTWLQTINETEEHYGSSLGTAADYDSVSNTGSFSGESEDPKDKVPTSATQRPEAIPGCDSDKRDKARQRNEKKHQRQRERRAQELHEKCISYLMSRKLEVLSQQLVSMGFSSERATMALILNEGRVEDSVSWLFDGEDKQVDAANLGNCNLKIDIKEEVDRIMEMEIKFKCSKQEVQRAIISCEGDMEKAAETLKTQKQEMPATAQKIENSGGVNNVTSSTQIPAAKLSEKSSVSESIQQPREHKDVNPSKVMGVSLPDKGSKSSQPLRGMQPKMDWTRAQTTTQVEHGWPSPNPSLSGSPLPSSLQAAVLSAKAEALRDLGGSAIKNNSKTGALTEPVIMMQRPQSISAKQNPAAVGMGISTTPSISRGSYGITNTEIINSLDRRLGKPGFDARNYSPSQPFYLRRHHQSSVANLRDNSAALWSAGSVTGWASSGSHSYGSTDWSSGGPIPQFDYTSIDWSHDLTPSRQNSISPLMTDRLHETWSTAFMGARPVNAGRNDAGVAGTEDSGLLLRNSASFLASHEWTSPFAGNDLLRVPRQIVTSPPLHERGFKTERKEQK